MAVDFLPLPAIEYMHRCLTSLRNGTSVGIEVRGTGSQRGLPAAAVKSADPIVNSSKRSVGSNKGTFLRRAESSAADGAEKMQSLSWTGAKLTAVVENCRGYCEHVTLMIRPCSCPPGRCKYRKYLPHRPRLSALSLKIELPRHHK